MKCWFCEQEARGTCAACGFRIGGVAARVVRFRPLGMAVSSVRVKAMGGRRPRSCERAGTLLIGIATRRDSRPGVTSDLRTRPSTMLTDGLTNMFSTSGAPVYCLPLPALAVNRVPERPFPGEPVSFVIASAVQGWVEANKLLKKAHLR